MSDMFYGGAMSSLFTSSITIGEARLRQQQALQEEQEMRRFEEAQVEQQMMEEQRKLEESYEFKITVQSKWPDV